jgi:hypothetical protein
LDLRRLRLHATAVNIAHPLGASWGCHRSSNSAVLLDECRVKLGSPACPIRSRGLNERYT